MSGPPVSVVVVSHARPEALRLCLLALQFQMYPDFEVIVVADKPGLAAVRRLDFADRVKTVENAQIGIARARNLGVAQAAGDIVAFLDDDAVADPYWLTHLVAAFEGAKVVAAGGFVRGRNGISYQWTGGQITETADPLPLQMTDMAPKTFAGERGKSVVTLGVNMAFRRQALCDIGGFDPAFRFHLEEADVNLRLSRAGGATAVVPLAQVHHMRAASIWRSHARAPKSLFDVGASTAMFLRKHAPVATHPDALDRLRTHHRRRNLQYMVDGDLEPRDVRFLSKSLEQGIAFGVSEQIPAHAIEESVASAFKPFTRLKTAGPTHVAGRFWQGKSLRRAARKLAADRHPTSVFLLSPTMLYHRRRFDADGYWTQSGGLFGRADRSEPIFQKYGFRARVAQEAARISETGTIPASFRRQDAAGAK